MITQNSACAACGSQKMEIVNSTNRRILFLCGDCGTGNIYPRNIEESRDMYPESYYRLPVLSAVNSVLKRIVFHNNRVSQIEKFIKTGVILDFGCGDGGFIASFEQKHWERYGYDTSTGALNIAKTRGIEIYGYQLNTLSNNSRVDVITCIHVLEHLDSPRKYLLDFNSRLNKNGYLLIEVPNYNSLGSRIFKNRWPPNADIPRHLTHFSPKGLSTILKSSGFEVVKETDSLLGNFLFTNYLVFVLIKGTVKSSWVTLLATTLVSPIIALYVGLGNKDSIQMLFRKAA